MRLDGVTGCSAKRGRRFPHQRAHGASSDQLENAQTHTIGSMKYFIRSKNFYLAFFSATFFVSAFPFSPLYRDPRLQNQLSCVD